MLIKWCTMIGRSFSIRTTMKPIILKCSSESSRRLILILIMKVEPRAMIWCSKTRLILSIKIKIWEWSMKMKYWRNSRCWSCSSSSSWGIRFEMRYYLQLLLVNIHNLVLVLVLVLLILLVPLFSICKTPARNTSSSMTGIQKKCVVKHHLISQISSSHKLFKNLNTSYNNNNNKVNK